MDREDALLLARQMFQELAESRPPSSFSPLARHVREEIKTYIKPYLERAAVLVDVLSYAGFEDEAEQLALAVAGRFPRDQAYPMDVVTGILRTPGDPIEDLSTKFDVLEREIGTIYQRIFGYGAFHGPERRRVQIVRAGSSYFKPGQYGYVTAWDMRGGMHAQDKDQPMRAGERAYLVAKTRHGRGGAVWFSADGLRFTAARHRRAP